MSNAESASSTLGYPYNDVVLIEAEPSGSDDFIYGSGVIIGPHTILTASHVVFDVLTQTPYASIFIYPGYNTNGIPDPPGTDAPLAAQWVDHYNVIGSLGDDSLSPAQSSEDYAVIDVSTTFKSWFDVQTNFDGGAVNYSGYPQYAPGVQTELSGTVTANSDYPLLDNTGLTGIAPGASGGPEWINEGTASDPQPYVVGVISTEPSAVQITSSDWAQIESWEADDSYLWDNFAVSNVTASADTSASTLGAGHVVAITLDLTEAATVTGTPTLQLNDGETATYVGGSGTDALTFDYVVQVGDVTGDLQVTGIGLPPGASIANSSGDDLSTSISHNLELNVDGAFPFVANADLVEALFVGYLGRAAFPAGDSYWVGQLADDQISLSDAAAAFALQPGSEALYPFLADPANASASETTSFIDAVFEDLFNRAPQPAGLAYWQNQLSADLGDPQAVGSFILGVISGATGSGQTTVANKVAVAEYLTQSFAAAGIDLSTNSAAFTEAHIVSSVTSLASSVTSAEAQIAGWVRANP